MVTNIVPSRKSTLHVVVYVCLIALAVIGLTYLAHGLIMANKLRAFMPF